MTFDTLRQTMVDSQLKTVGVNDPAVLAAMGVVPRERYVPSAAKGVAYSDTAIQIAPARWLLEPMVLGLLLTHARIDAADRVLVVGSATGYSAMVCGRIAARVVALEEDEGLAHVAGMLGVNTITGPLAEGWPEGAPYTLMLFEGAIEEVPDALAAQLAPGGRVAAVVRQGTVGSAIVGPLVGNRIAGLAFVEVAARPLPGFTRARAFAF